VEECQRFVQEKGYKLSFHRLTMSNKYNQFIKTQMRNEQPDKEKLITIASFLRREYHLTVQREAICMFDKEDGHLVDFATWITEEQYNKYEIHVPDLLFYVGNKLWIIEVDGFIHMTSTHVVRKDERRDDCYNKAKLNWRKINEWEVLIKLGKKPNRSATAKEVITEIKEIMKEIMLDYEESNKHQAS